MPKNTRTERRIGALYNRTLGRFVPRTHFFAMLFLPIFNSLLYFLIPIAVKNADKGSLALPIDGRIPLMEEFIIIYFASYIFWFAGLFYLAYHKDSSFFFNGFSRILVGLLVTFFCFAVFPLEIVRPTVTEEGIWGDLVRLLYSIDAPNNLCPSLHCFFNWILYVQIRGKKEYPLALRLFSCIFSFAVFASTLFTKQHFLLDVVGGVLLAELTVFIVKTPLPRFFKRMFEGLDTLVFTKKTKDT